jgi:hypothetical protein
MEPSDWQKNLLLLKNGIKELEDNFNVKIHRFQPFKNIYTEISKTYERFASSLIILTETIDS